jgi:hypothetical protein
MCSPADDLQNAGAEASIVVGKVKESKDENFGYNAQTDQFEDLVAAVVIDPTKVTRTALQNGLDRREAAHDGVCRGREEGGSADARWRRYGRDVPATLKTRKTRRTRRLRPGWPLGASISAQASRYSLCQRSIL